MGLFHQGLTGILPVSNFDEVRAFMKIAWALLKRRNGPTARAIAAPDTL